MLNTTESCFEDDKGFNGTARYILPFNEGENARLLEQHIGFKLLRNGNFISPIEQKLKEGIHVLDSACGHGAPWTMDMAEAYPKSRFLGVDISDGFPVQCPSNTKFSVGNVTKAIPASDDTFDFVFQRLVFGALSSEEWNSDLKEIYRVLKPGGCVELLEHHLVAFNEGPLMKLLNARVYQLFLNRGLVFNISIELNDRMKEIGFIDCGTVAHEFPTNHGDNGESYWRPMRGAYQGLVKLLGQIYSEWEDEQVYYKFLDAVSEEIMNYKTYFKAYTNYAQKPL